MRLLCFTVFCFATAATIASEAEPVGDRMDREFREKIGPFLTTYCLSCHDSDAPEADLDLGGYASAASVARDIRRWELVLERLDSGDMPPEDADPRPADDLRREVVTWVRSVREFEAERTAGDPGAVPARRLSNAEYDNTIRDLTGADIRPTRDFPVDPANEAGFDNSGESLAMSPALLDKYLEAARKVADHVVFTPDGLAFASHPAITETDRDKYAVNRIIAFYKRHRTDFADYFEAAWRFERRAALGRPDSTLEEFAADAHLSPKYLATVHAALTGDPEPAGPIAALQALWRELPAPDAARPDAARPGCEAMRDLVVRLRKKLTPGVDNLTAPGIHDGAQAFVYWKNRQFAANRRRYAGGALELGDVGLPPGTPAARALTAPTDLASAEAYEATFARFCSIFPDAFVLSERARVYLDPEKEKDLTGRLLSAGLHSQMGYFRDDGPLYELVLDEGERRDLDRLWRELDFVTSAPMRQYAGMVWFERTDSRYLRDPEFDFARAEDKDVTSEAKIARLHELYVGKARRTGASDAALAAIEEHFKNISASIRWVERAHVAAEPLHLEALADLAQRAYRRPVTEKERQELQGFYRELRDRDALSHEDAVRDTLVRVLMSPHFCYRLDATLPGDGPVRPLTDYSLASRLSYFLWSSMPDDELLSLAASGTLHEPEMLRGQARRMLKDPRVRGLATEFGANWLDVRRFEEHNAVDRERFPTFDDELRSAMFEEPIRFLIDLAARDGSVFELLEGDHTFVNPPLARNYGMPEPDGGADAWVRIDNASRYGRGGLLPMAVFLTKNAPGLRTSPVKRGYWVARRILDEHIPAPPPQVPELPADETKLGELTLRETLERHRADKACSGCHEKFDSFGLAFEGYGPVGELRTLDLGGKPVDARADFPGDVEGTGFEGLRSYLRDHRREQFVENLCRKLLAYALDRSLLPSDDRTIREMRSKLLAEGHRFGAMIDLIVTSPQFLNKRVAADAYVEADPIEEPIR